MRESDDEDPRESDASAGASGAERVTRYKGLALSRFQIRAIEAIRAGHNVLVTAPTGAGKTLVAEYAIEDAVRRGRRCIYTAPIKALSNQKYRDFRDDPAVDVGLMTGDVTINPGAQVLIMTTEILRNAIFESPASLHDVEFAIFDEVHFLDDPERGTVWEECLIFAPPEIRLLCLSATIPNVDELGAWLREIRSQELVVVRSDLRPVPLEHRFALGRPGAQRSSGIFPLARLQAVRRAESRDRDRGRQGGRSGRGRGTPVPDPSGLLDELERQGLLPVLVFSFSRRDCERQARANRHRRLLDADEERRMVDLQAELVELFQLDPAVLEGEVFELARRGLGYHHAGMLPIHKEVVERMFTSELIKMLFTTETFALGINMPARTVVFASLRKFDGVQFDYLRTREYQQMAGRAGRQGIDEQGLVVSLLGESDLDEGPLGRIVDGRAEPVESRFRLSYSSILHLVSRLSRAGLHEAWDKSFNRFQHQERSRGAKERNRREQGALLDRHLGLLSELRYLDDADRLTPRGEVARLLYGYELQITELVFRGALETLPPAALAVIFVGLVHEDRRRRTGSVYVPPRLFGGVRRHVTEVVAALARREAALGIPTPMKEPDWGLTPAVLAWIEGATFDALAEITDATPGDMCRTFRMALQLMRQLRRAMEREWDVAERLLEVAELLNRDEVDARRQLELG